MKLTLFVCFVLCCATLASAGKPWKRMRSKLRRFIKPYADFVHVVSGHQRTTLDGFELTKTAAVLLTKAVNIKAPIGGWPLSTVGFVQFSDHNRTLWNPYTDNTQFLPRSYATLEEYQQAIRERVFQNGSYAAVENGLFKARLIHEIWTETGVISKIAWLVTNRFTEIGLTAKAEAILMKLRQGIKLFVVGIRTQKMRKELRKLASKGCYFEFNSYKDYKDTVVKAVDRM